MRGRQPTDITGPGAGWLAVRGIRPTARILRSDKPWLPMTIRSVQSAFHLLSACPFEYCGSPAPTLAHDGIRIMEASPAKPTLQSEITCPECGHAETETMAEDACQWFYDCKQCGATLRPKPGDCCVFCSYGTVPCPPVQTGRDCCS